MTVIYIEYNQDRLKLLIKSFKENDVPSLDIFGRRTFQSLEKEEIFFLSFELGKVLTKYIFLIYLLNTLLNASSIFEASTESSNIYPPSSHNSVNIKSMKIHSIGRKELNNFSNCQFYD